MVAKDFIPGTNITPDDLYNITVNNGKIARCKACNKDLGAYVQVMEKDSQGRQRVSSMVDPAERRDRMDGITPFALIICTDCYKTLSQYRAPEL